VTSNLLHYTTSAL